MCGRLRPNGQIYWSHSHTWTADDAAGGWITGVMTVCVRVTSETVDRTVRRVVVGVAVQLVSQRQTDTAKHNRLESTCVLY